MTIYGELIWLGQVCWEASGWAARGAMWIWSARFAFYAAVAWAIAFHLVVQK